MEAENSSNGNVSPRRRFLRKRHAEIINIPPKEEDEGSGDSDGDEDDEEPLPADGNKRGNGHVSVKEALEGLFSPGNISSSTKE